MIEMEPNDEMQCNRTDIGQRERESKDVTEVDKIIDKQGNACNE